VIFIWAKYTFTLDLVIAFTQNKQLKFVLRYKDTKITLFI